MKAKRVFKLVHAGARHGAIEAVRTAPDGFCVQVSEPTRTLDQNAAQWPILTAFSEQLLWPVNGERVRMSPDEWKDVLTAAFMREQVRVAHGLDGGVVMLGLRTSEFGKRVFSDWIEFLHATAATRGVVVYPDNEPSAVQRAVKFHKQPAHA